MNAFIQQHKKWIIGGLAAFVLFCCSCVFGAALVDKKEVIVTPTPVILSRAVNTPTQKIIPTLEVTKTPIPTNVPLEPTQIVALTVYQYSAKATQWNITFQRINNTVLDALNGKDVPKEDLTKAATDLILLQADIHNTTPPDALVPFHTHFTAAIDYYAQGVKLLGQGQITQATNTLKKAIDEMNAAKTAIP